jgi:hypothetical protein
MIDTEEFNNFIVERPEFIPETKVIPINSKDRIQLSDEELLLCTYLLPGFALTSKSWGLFDVSHLKRVEYNEEAFASLVLSPDTKKVLSSLVQLQDSESKFDDLVAGKGKGLIILLHGLPGVGKTFTAGTWSLSNVE